MADARANWSQVKADEWVRTDGARVYLKAFGTGMWSWTGPEGEKPAPGTRGKPTAEAAMDHVDAEWALGAGVVEGHGMGADSIRAVARARELAALGRRPEAEAELARLLERAEAQPSGRSRGEDDPLEALPPSVFARGVIGGTSAPSSRSPLTYARAGALSRVSPPTYRPLPQVEAAVDAELARSTRRAPFASVRAPMVPASLPPPIASVYAPAPSRAREEAPTRAPEPAPSTRRSALMQAAAAVPRGGTLADAKQECGVKEIEAALARHPGNKTAAARELGITREWLATMMKRKGLWKPDPHVSAVRREAGRKGATERWGSAPD